MKLLVRSLRQGVVVSTLLFLLVIATGGLRPDYWMLYVLWAGVSLGIGLVLVIPHYLRSRQAARARARSEEFTAAQIDRWRRGDSGFRKKAEFSGHVFELHVSGRSGNFRGRLHGAGVGDVIAFRQWPRHPGALKGMLKRGDVMGEILLSPGVVIPVTVSQEVENVSIRCGSHPPYLVHRKSVDQGRRSLVVRDILGWRIAADAFPGGEGVMRSGPAFQGARYGVSGRLPQADPRTGPWLDDGRRRGGLLRRVGQRDHWTRGMRQALEGCDR
ncbi:hypothetical protein E1265_07485 [Streptomyces sp. 8K308]|uniref:hypothetical protein n=1 Tax=Streptomyces sp. 8K308 TaxID=2530388 RepID=UPI001052D24E|nr:hypothetical protein [Streptomyces sp. 8K308]TDC25296.1 hypothetical protein E1265_07485 [Streptomyces sp. 8K308]